MEQVAKVADPRPVTPREAQPADGMRADIQGLRAVAVLVVLLFHFWPKRLTGGYVGVDVFFVISGFLISSHLLRTPPTSPRLLAAFWARRVRRLLPAASLVLLVSFVAAYVARHTLGYGADGGEVMRVTGTVAFAAYGISRIKDSIWHGQPWPNTVRQMIDAGFYSLATGFVFRLMWPVAV